MILLSLWVHQSGVQGGTTLLGAGPSVRSLSQNGTECGKSRELRHTMGQQNP